MKYIKLISHNLYKADIYSTEGYLPFPGSGHFIYLYMLNSVYPTKITSMGYFPKAIEMHTPISLN